MSDPRSTARGLGPGDDDLALVEAHTRRFSRRLALGMALATLTALFLAVSLTPITNNDIWLHIANGNWIVEHGQVPLHDPYSFSAAGNRFYAHEWLAGLIFAAVYNLAGVPGLIVFKTLLGGIALFICAAVGRRLGAGWTSTLATTGVALVIVNSRFLERPEMFSYALTAIYLWVLVDERRRSEQDSATSDLARLRQPRWLLAASRLWLLVPLQWLWVQLHGYFLTGIAMVGLFLVGQWLTHYLARTGVQGIARFRRLPSPRLLSGSVAGLALIAVGFANPNGIEIYTFPFKLAGSVFTETIFEWRPTFVTADIIQSSMFLAFCLWLALLLVGCFDSRRVLARTGLWRCLVVAGLTWLAFVGWSLHEPTAAGTLAASTWLWSPSDLLFSLTGSYRLHTFMDAAGAVLRIAGPLGDDLFTLTWVGLATFAALTWRRPTVAGLTVLTVSLTFAVFDAERLAGAALQNALRDLARAGNPALLARLATDLAAVGPAATLTIIVLVGAALLSATRRGRRPPWEVLVTIFFIYMAVKQNRNIVNLALVTLPFVAVSLTRTAQALPIVTLRRQPRRGMFAWLTAETGRLAVLAVLYAGLLTLTLAAGWPYTPRITKKVGLSVGERVPTAAVDYIRRHSIHGNVFNKYAYGAYLIHELYPETRVFMDSRNDVYGPGLYATYLRSLHNVEVARRVFEKYDFDYVLVDYRFYPNANPDTGLLSYLRDDPEWVLVYFDHTSLLFVTATPAHADLIARDGYRLIDPTTYAPGIAARLTTGELAAWGEESIRALEQAPAAVPARMIRVDFLAATGRLREALDLLNAVLAVEPRNLVALVGSARLFHHIGDDTRAREFYRRALQWQPDLDNLREELDALDARDGAAS